MTRSAAMGKNPVDGGQPAHKHEDNSAIGKQQATAETPKPLFGSEESTNTGKTQLVTKMKVSLRRHPNDCRTDNLPLEI